MVELSRLPADAFPEGSQGPTEIHSPSLSTPLTRSLAARNQTDAKVEIAKKDSFTGVVPDSSAKLKSTVKTDLAPQVGKSAGKLKQLDQDILQKYCQLANEKERLRQIGAFENIRLYNKERDKALEGGATPLQEAQAKVLEKGIVSQPATTRAEKKAVGERKISTSTSKTTTGETSETPNNTAVINRYLNKPGGNEADKKVIRQYLLSSEQTKELKDKIEQRILSGKTEGDWTQDFVKEIKAEQKQWKEVEKFLKSPLSQGTKLNRDIARVNKWYEMNDVSPRKYWLNDAAKSSSSMLEKFAAQKKEPFFTRMANSIGRFLERIFGD
jgi:hypothetical protein